MPGAPHQLVLNVRLRERSVFESFHPGRNRELIRTLDAMSTAAHPRPLWLHGSRGVGKTHVLQAVCARAGVAGLAAAYLPLDALCDLGADVLAGCGTFDWVCVDSLDVVIGKVSWEQALFALFHELEDHGACLIVAASSAPSALPFRLPDLASRLASGPVYRLRALDDDEQRAALQLRARLRGIELTDETARFLQRRMPRDMESLCDFLDALDDASLAAHRRLTVPFVKEVLEARAAR